MTITSLVISQPFYFPWLGHFQQLRHADKYVVYDDVQYARGFINRVKVRNKSGLKWLTLPLSSFPRESMISSVQVSEIEDWRAGQRNTLIDAYRTAPFLDDVLGLHSAAVSGSGSCLSEIATLSIQLVASYLNIPLREKTALSSNLASVGKGSKRILSICKGLGADTYITGWGAKGYLEHEDFDNAGIDVRYPIYEIKPYDQGFGDFQSHLSVLDAIAHLGPRTADLTYCETKHWRDFIGKSDI